MSRNEFDFDEHAIIETLINNQVEVRTSRFIATFCVSVTFVMLFVMGAVGTLILSNISQQSPNPIIVKEPN